MRSEIDNSFAFLFQVTAEGDQISKSEVDGTKLLNEMGSWDIEVLFYSQQSVKAVIKILTVIFRFFTNFLHVAQLERIQ